MKKKILIALFAVIISCLFSFAVSAANEVTLTDGTKADLEAVFKVQNNQITGFNTGYTKNDVTDVIFPDEIDGLEANFLFGEAVNLKTLTFESTDTFFISGDAIFSKCSVEKITFNPDCVVELRKGNFSNCASLTEITFPKFKKLAGSAFAGCSNMKSTNELILAEGMTEIGGHVFNGCTSLSGTVYFPSTLEKIQEYSFQKTGFEHFDLSKCINLTAVGGGYGGPFTDNDKITSLDLSACVKLTSLKNSFAQGCDNLTEVILPPNLETIPHKALAHCYKLQSIVLPASVTYVADEAFHSARNGQAVKTFTVYIQSNVKFHETYPFRDSGAKIEFVLIGDGVTLESFKAANTYAGITNATVVDYLDPASPWTYTVGQTITNHTIVENYCKSLAITGEHQFSDKISITYENGFGNVGSKITSCMNEKCGYEKNTEAKALFVCQGYSTPENGKAALVIGYLINNEAIREYEEATGKVLNYGVFAATQGAIENKDVFDKAENAISGAIAVAMESNKYKSFEFRISGFTDENKDAKLAIGAYVAEIDGNAINYSYIQDSSPNEGEKYQFVSYTDIASSQIG